MTKLSNLSLLTILLTTIFIFLGFIYFLNKNKRTFSQFPSNNHTAIKYSCPKNGWVNCMPILTEESEKLCTDEAYIWYKNNCPDFQGLAE